MNEIEKAKDIVIAEKLIDVRFLDKVIDVGFFKEELIYIDFKFSKEETREFLETIDFKKCDGIQFWRGEGGIEVCLGYGKPKKLFFKPFGFLFLESEMRELVFTGKRYIIKFEDLVLKFIKDSVTEMMYQILKNSKDLEEVKYTIKLLSLPVKVLE